MPIGPSCKPEFILDSIESARYYLNPSHKFIMIDDSMKGTGAAVQLQHPDADLITITQGLGERKNYGLLSGLYLSLSKGLKHAYEFYEFDVLLRMDTDALVIGPRPDDDAVAAFRSDPSVGLIGSFRVDCRGNVRGYQQTIQNLNESLSVKELIRHPRSRFP